MQHKLIAAISLSIARRISYPRNGDASRTTNTASAVFKCACLKRFNSLPFEARSATQGPQFKNASYFAYILLIQFNILNIFIWIYTKLAISHQIVPDDNSSSCQQMKKKIKNKVPTCNDGMMGHVSHCSCFFFTINTWSRSLSKHVGTQTGGLGEQWTGVLPY